MLPKGNNPQEKPGARPGSRSRLRRLDPRAPVLHEPPDRQHNNRADDCTNESRTFAGAIPAEGLTQERRNEMKPWGSFGPGMMNFAITPAMKPMMMVQMMPMCAPPQAERNAAQAAV
jgi:hypothetical protein